VIFSPLLTVLHHLMVLAIKLLFVLIVLICHLCRQLIVSQLPQMSTLGSTPYTPSSFGRKSLFYCIFCYFGHATFKECNCSYKCWYNYREL